MKCLILAAGYATRLYPLTANFPKPLLKIGEKTILDWLADDLDTCGEITEYAVVSNHRFAKFFEEWAKTKPQKISVVDDMTSANETRLGAVKDIQFALDTLRWDDDVLIIAGDNVLDFSLTGFIRFARDKKTSCVMRYYEPDEQKLRKCGVAEVDENDRITSLTEKPPCPKSHWICPPFYYYIRRDIARIGESIADGCNADAPGSFLGWICRQTTVFAMEMPGSRYDIGNLASYEKVQKEYRGITK